MKMTTRYATLINAALTSLALACDRANPPSTAPRPIASKVAFVVQPGAAQTADFTISPVIAVAIEDALGNTVTSASDIVIVTLGANPGGGTLAGTTSAAALRGVATFPNLSIDKAGAGYTLTAAAAGLTGATSASFDITPAGPAKLAFTVQPANAIAGVAISPAVAVAIEDASGHTVTSATDAVTLTVALVVQDTSGNQFQAPKRLTSETKAMTVAYGADRTISGTTTVNAVNGVATFSNLSIQQANTGYTLTASSGTSTSATSNSFNIIPAAPATLAFAVPPSDAYAAHPMSPTVRVAIQDAFANTVTSATNAVTLALGANPGGATLGGTLTAPAVNGVASFANLSVDRPGSGYTLMATSRTLTGATSSPFAVVLAGLIAFVNEDQAVTALGIATMFPDGSGVVSLTASGTDNAPAWSPDGRKIAFLRGVPCSPGPSCSHVFTMNADGTGVTDILPGDAGTARNWVAWKPDGSRIAFTGTYQQTAGLYLMDPDGSHVALVVAGIGLGHPSWSPDGSRMTVECNGNSDLCVVNADGTGLAPLMSDGDEEPDAELRPAWKPDGTRILFVESGPSQSFDGLRVINPDGSGMTAIVSTGGAVDFPAWSPDGQRIAFMEPGKCDSYGCAPDAILVAHADGSGQQVFIHAGTDPAWRR